MKDPAFLFYSGDFLTGVIGFDMEERGQYITLLCTQHAKGRMSLDFIKKVIPNIQSSVLEKFTIDKDGLYYNERLEYEAIKRAKFTESRRKNLNKPHMDSHMVIHMEAHMENENISIDSNDNSSIVSNTIISEKSKKKSTDIVKSADTWNGLKVGSKIPKRKHTIKPIEDFIADRVAEGKRSCAPLDAELVWLSDAEYHKLKEKYRFTEVVNEMIREMHRWKSKREEGVQVNRSDFLAIDATWVFKNAMEVMRLQNSPIYDKMRKQEIMKQEFKKSSQTIFYTPIENGSEKTSE